MSDLFGFVGDAQVSAKGVRRLERGHPWVYESDVVGRAGTEAGFVRVLDPGGKILGAALYSPKSAILLRLWKRGKKPVSVDDLRQRMRSAALRRKAPYSGRSSYRFIHGEADLLPGVFVDRYRDYFAVQTTCAASASLEDSLVEFLATDHGAAAVVLRNNAAVRAKEGLAREIRVAHGSSPVQTSYFEGSIEFEVDLLGEQKTGAFLDQVDNHIRAGRYASGRGLDLFTYHGGFALQLAKFGCEEVTAVDQSDTALEFVVDAAAKNNITGVATIRADAPKWLSERAGGDERYDIIIVDPPAFASTARTLDRALRAYEKINRDACQLLAPGGFLMSCSCSGRVDGAAFDAMLNRALQKAGRVGAIVERSGAGPDHPVLSNVPETEYLKCRVLQVY